MEEIQLYHGSNHKFDKFSLDYIGTNGTSEGYGIYLSTSPQIAMHYAKPYLYTVCVSLNRHISTKTKMSKYEYEQLLIAVDKKTDILSNYGEIAYSGYNTVLKEALATYLMSTNDVDLLAELCNTSGQIDVVNQLAHDLLGITHIIEENPDWQNDYTHQIYVILNPNIIKIQDVTIHKSDSNIS